MSKIPPKYVKLNILPTYTSPFEIYLLNNVTHVTQQFDINIFLNFIDTNLLSKLIISVNERLTNRYCDIINVPQLTLFKVLIAVFRDIYIDKEVIERELILDLISYCFMFHTENIKLYTLINRDPVRIAIFSFRQFGKSYVLKLACAILFYWQIKKANIGFLYNVLIGADNTANTSSIIQDILSILKTDLNIEVYNNQSIYNKKDPHTYKINIHPLYSNCEVKTCSITKRGYKGRGSHPDATVFDELGEIIATEFEKNIQPILTAFADRSFLGVGTPHNEQPNFIKNITYNITSVCSKCIEGNNDMMIKCVHLLYNRSIFDGLHVVLNNSDTLFTDTISTLAYLRETRGCLLEAQSIADVAAFDKFAGAITNDKNKISALYLESFLDLCIVIDPPGGCITEDDFMSKFGIVVYIRKCTYDKLNMKTKGQLVVNNADILTVLFCSEFHIFKDPVFSGSVLDIILNDVFKLITDLKLKEKITNSYIYVELNNNSDVVQPCIITCINSMKRHGIIPYIGIKISRHNENIFTLGIYTSAALKMTGYNAMLQKRWYVLTTIPAIKTSLKDNNPIIQRIQVDNHPIVISKKDHLPIHIQSILPAYATIIKRQEKTDNTNISGKTLKQSDDLIITFILSFYLDFVLTNNLYRTTVRDCYYFRAKTNCFYV